MDKRKSYKTPKLVEYGSIEQVTRGQWAPGSGDIPWAAFGHDTKCDSNAPPQYCSGS